MSLVDFAYFDCDNHFYESPDAFTRARYRAPEVVRVYRSTVKCPFSRAFSLGPVPGLGKIRSRTLPGSTVMADTPTSNPAEIAPARTGLANDGLR